MQNIYETFEFSKIKEFINEYTKTEVGSKKVNNLLNLVISFHIT